MPIRPEGPPTWPPDWPEVREAVEATLADGSWGRYHGPHCERLEEALAEFHGVEEVLLCCSGTAAVELALHGARVGPGDEVILAAYDFKANFQNVLALGATPVLVDLDPNSWQLDPTQLDSAVTEATRAIIVSHLHGASVPMAPILEFANQHGVTVIEDACQVTGAILDGQRAGAAGHAGVLSFGGSKLLTAGRGGAILTSRADLAQRIRLRTQRGNHAYPLSELQAAVLQPQVERLETRNRVRLANVQSLLSQLDAAGVLAGLTPLNATPGELDAFYKVGFRYDSDHFKGLSRDAFAQAVRNEGVALDPGFRSLHRIHSRRRFLAVGDLQVADAADDGILVLHHPVLLESAAAIDQIVEAVLKVGTATG
jgi:dTDP-4-amino-4,6-dideoxygalactose transaminase